MSFERLRLSPSSQVPQLDPHGGTTTGQRLAIGAERNTPDTTLMAIEDLQLALSFQIPQLDASSVTATGQRLAIVAERHTIDGTLVSIEGLQLDPNFAQAKVNLDRLRTGSPQS